MPRSSPKSASPSSSRASLECSPATRSTPRCGRAPLGGVGGLATPPPVPKGGQAGDECSFPACFISSTLEFPAPHTVINLAPNDAPPPAVGAYFQPAISSTLLTMWIVIAIV